MKCTAKDSSWHECIPPPPTIQPHPIPPTTVVYVGGVETGNPQAYSSLAGAASVGLSPAARCSGCCWVVAAVASEF